MGQNQSLSESQKQSLNENLNQPLFDVHQKDLALEDDLPKSCMKTVTEFIPYFLECMRQSDPLFNVLFKNDVFYGGSHYDGLKINEATEFDLNIVIRLPFGEDYFFFNTFEMPGFVSICLVVPLDGLVRYELIFEQDLMSELFNPCRTPEFALYMRIGDFFHGKMLMPEKVRNWFEGVCAKAQEQASREMQRYNIQSMSLKKSDPALTLEIQTPHLPEIHIDLGLVYRLEDLINDDSTYCVPEPHAGDQFMWRIWTCSYPMKERYLLGNGGCAKVIIKLLKKLRDKQGWHDLASYYLKTVVMLTKKELNAEYDAWEENKLGEYFIQTLEKLSSYLSKGFLPLYHDDGCNLIEKINPKTLSNINGSLRRIINDFKRFRSTRPAEEIMKYF